MCLGECVFSLLHIPMYTIVLLRDTLGFIISLLNILKKSCTCGWLTLCSTHVWVVFQRVYGSAYRLSALGNRDRTQTRRGWHSPLPATCVVTGVGCEQGQVAMGRGNQQKNISALPWAEFEKTDKIARTIFQYSHFVKWEKMYYQ